MSDDLLTLAREGRAAPPRLADKLEAFWDFAQSLAGLSTCKRLQVGCLVTDAGLTSVLAIGYNGPPKGLPNDGCRAEEGSCGCTHSEANALVKLQSPERGLILLVTTSPCEHCTGLIANCGRIATVIYGDAYRDTAGLQSLKSASIIPVKIKTLLKVRSRKCVVQPLVGG